MRPAPSGRHQVDTDRSPAANQTDARRAVGSDAWTLPRLSAIPFFAGLTDRELEAVASAASEAGAEEGQTLAAAGDFGHALYVIESGTATVTADGEPLRELGPGDVFGEIAVLASGRRTSSVVATSPMRLIVLLQA